MRSGEVQFLRGGGRLHFGQGLRTSEKRASKKFAAGHRLGRGEAVVRDRPSHMLSVLAPARSSLALSVCQY